MGQSDNTIRRGAAGPAPGGFICVAAGGMIDTPRGPVPVEALRQGDVVRTQGHDVTALTRVTAQRVDGRGAYAPVMIRAGVLGVRRDLFVAPGQALHFTGWHARTAFGVNAMTMTAAALAERKLAQVAKAGDVVYVFLETGANRAIMAQGLACAPAATQPDAATRALARAA